MSLLGSYRRQFGALTHLAYAAVFLVMVLHLRTGAQARRLLLAIAVGSLVPSLYALAQKAGMDPIPWSSGGSDRVGGTLGLSTYLGAYLAAALPASLCLLMAATSRRAKAAAAAPLALQVAALLFSQTRASWLGAAAGATVALAAAEGGRRLLARVGATRLALGALGVLALLLVVNLPDTSLNRLARSVPYLERAASLADFGSGSGRVRVLIWQAVPALVAERPLLGHGPDVMGYAFEHRYPTELAYLESRTAAADTAHNGLLQVLVSAGVLGLAAYLWLLGSALWALTRHLSRAGRADRNFDTRPSNPHPDPLPKGATRRRGDAKTRGLPHPDPLPKGQGVAGAALGGLVAGVVDGMAGVPSASAYLLFWLYLALAAAVAWGLHPGHSHPLPAAQPTAPRPRVSLSPRLPVPPSPRPAWVRLGAAAALLAGAGPGIVQSSVLPLLADVAAAEGSALAAQGRFREAEAAFRQTMATSREAEYPLLLGQMAIRAAEGAPTAEAEAWLRRGEEALRVAEGLNPLELDVALAQGKLHQGWARLPGHGAEWARAEDAFRRALALSPRRAYVHNRYGAVLAAQGRHREALAEYRVSVGLDPGYAATHGFMGDALVALGSPEEALAAYLEARRLDPDLVLVRINLAELYLRLGRPRDAVREYEAAVALAPGDSALRLRLEGLRSR